MQAVLPNPAFLSFCTVRTQGISVYFTGKAALEKYMRLRRNDVAVAMMLALKRK